ncbi:dienelactone hydrolase family protein [Pseudonocardia sp. GCM10023141]|uniref:dienelactone hydrolase family protein n=1 Tax=Pseudonocardia sp. GCM10023141 TaxID=3252653 RepID=UPI00361934ED
MNPLRYQDGRTPLTGHLVDRHRNPGPGVLVVHGGAGLDDHARTQAERIADLGYVALACDMYGDGVAGDRDRTMAVITALTSDPAALRRRAGAGLRALVAHPGVDGRIAAVGYCFGGMTVLEMARGDTALAGVASIHGSLAARHGGAAAISAPVLACHGALDPHVPMADVLAFTAEMSAADADWQLLVLGGAQHGFTHTTPSPGPGVAYDAVADARSFAALAAFLEDVFSE